MKKDSLKFDINNAKNIEKFYVNEDRRKAAQAALKGGAREQAAFFNDKFNHQNEFRQTKMKTEANERAK